MRDVTIIKLSDPEGELAPEFAYLFGFCVAEAAAVFASVNVVKVDPGGGWQGIEERLGQGLVLLLGPENVLVRRDSLGAMAAAIAGGEEIVAPFELAATEIAQQRALHTLRDYERAEEEFLSAEKNSEEAAFCLPFSLMEAATFVRLAAERSPAQLLESGSSEAFGKASRSGLGHRFIDYYGQAREDILPYLEGAGREVLEIGCGRGTTGEVLKQKLDCRVTGVEKNAEVARAARAVLDEVIEGDVEALDLDGRFDVVLALELFEHLVEGERFLEKAKAWLRPGGRVVLSVPNVGHYSIVEDLLEGRWDYLPIGLLCYTHYRFFTRFTLEQWLRRCGFEDFEIVAQKTELPDCFSELPAALPVDLESLATSGFYVIARKP